MLRIPVQSRKGNVALVILGTVYCVGALSVLAWFVIDVRNAAAAVDRLMQMSLIVSAAFGIWAIANALENLGLRSSRRGLSQFDRTSSGVLWQK
jgi:hypothetical protein